MGAFGAIWASGNMIDSRDRVPSLIPKSEDLVDSFRIKSFSLGSHVLLLAWPVADELEPGLEEVRDLANLAPPEGVKVSRLSLCVFLLILSVSWPSPAGLDGE